MKKTTSTKVSIPPNALVKVTQTKHIVEVQHMEKMNTKANIKKIDKDRYIEIATGEIKEFKHIENRQQSYNSLRQTFKKTRYLINNNLEGKPNELHVTLTYKENMTDTKILYKDFKNFMDRLRYKYKKETTIDYITVVEPQERGAWHCHVLMRFNDLEKIYVKSSDMEELWGQGFVKIKALKGVDNIGAYLSAYLSDVELNEESAKIAIQEGRDIKTKVIEGKEKRFVKGGRLHMYPPGMNIVRKSKGMEYPPRLDMKYKEAKKIVGSAKPHYEKSYELEKDDFKNTLSYEQYNLKRKSIEQQK
jgi:hypothetical protein